MGTTARRLAQTVTAVAVTLGLAVVGFESGAGTDIDAAAAATPGPVDSIPADSVPDPAAPVASDPAASDPGAADPAAADPDVPAPLPQGPIILDARQAAYLCRTRIPAIVSRVDQATARINADAATVGSTAWLAARRDKARAAGHTDLADRIQKRIDGRPDVLTQLADAKQRATVFRTDNCAS